MLMAFLFSLTQRNGAHFFPGKLSSFLSSTQELLSFLPAGGGIPVTPVDDVRGSWTSKNAGYLLPSQEDISFSSAELLVKLQRYIPPPGLFLLRFLPVETFSFA